jgi:hypothetical protein
LKLDHAYESFEKKPLLSSKQDQGFLFRDQNAFSGGDIGHKGQQQQSTTKKEKIPEKLPNQT